jgi:hypothetical protein
MDHLDLVDRPDHQDPLETLVRLDPLELPAQEFLPAVQLDSF